MKESVYEKIHVNEKLLNEGHIQLEKIRTQNIIKNFIDQHNVIDQYKTIKKSIIKIENMIKDADDRGVRIDLDFRQLAKATNERILAERNLRYELGNLCVETSNIDQVENLTMLIQTAQNKGVAQNYLDEAGNLKKMMEESIKIQKIIRDIMAYPMRFDEHNTKKRVDIIKCYPKKFIYYDHDGDSKFHEVGYPNRQLLIDKKNMLGLT